MLSRFYRLEIDPTKNLANLNLVTSWPLFIFFQFVFQKSFQSNTNSNAIVRRCSILIYFYSSIFLCFIILHVYSSLHNFANVLRLNNSSKKFFFGRYLNARIFLQLLSSIHICLQELYFNELFGSLPYLH